MDANDPLLNTSAASKGAFHLIVLLHKIWTILGVVLLSITILEVSLTSHYERSDRRELQSAIKAAASSGVYANADLAEGYFKELADATDWPLPWATYTQSREADYAGEFINVKGGTRRTWNSGAINESNKLKIFFFGGSTMWGAGSRDDFTIPSLVAKKLAKNGIGATVTNYAVFGDVATQSVIRFILELRERNAPDLVIFYGGRNEAGSACIEGKPGVPYNNAVLERIYSDNKAKPRIRINLEYLALTRLLGGKKQRVGCSKVLTKLDELSDGALDVYLGNVRIVEAISRTLSFKTLFYLEPQLSDKTYRTKYEEDQLLKSEKHIPGRSDLYSLMRSKLVKREYESLGQNLVHDLRAIFFDVASPIYVDGWHYGEDGNERISRRIAADILSLYAPSK